MSVLLSTDLPFPVFRRGKVRDVYDLGKQLLIVATDRISAYDVVMPNGIPDKGRVLTQLSMFWFNLLRDILPNHVITSTDFPSGLAGAHDVEYAPYHICSSETVVHEIYHNAKYPSHLLLPVIPQ